MKIAALVAIALAAACGDSTPVQEADAVPGTPQRDAGTPGLAGTPLTCLTATATTTNTDGSTQIRDYLFAVVPNVDPSSDFMVEQCGPAYNTVCLPGPPGSNCVETGAVLPPGESCYWTRGGQFVGGSLVVFCGQRSRTINASGTVTSDNDSRLTAVRLHR